MGRSDQLKSLLRSAAMGARAQMGDMPLLNKAREAWGLVRDKKLHIQDAVLTAAVARLTDVSSATVTCAHGRVAVHASFADGSHLACSIVPVSVAFATHGAKELGMVVIPDSLSDDVRARAVIGAIAGCVAKTVWAPFLPKSSVTHASAFAHREGDQLVVDLRSVPEVRAAMSNPMTTEMLDAFGVRALSAEPGRLVIELKLGGLG